MAQLIDLQKVRRRMWRKRLHNLLFLAGFAAVVFGISFLVYHNGCQYDYCGICFWKWVPCCTARGQAFGDVLYG